MDRKKDEVRKGSNAKSKGKAVAKLKEEKNATKSVPECNPSGRKIAAHSGIYFQLSLKKPTDSAIESRLKQMDTSSYLTKKSESQRHKIEEETTILASMGNLEISKEPEVKLRDTKSHIYEAESAESVASNHCELTCKSCDRIMLLHAVCCSPQQSELPEVAKDAKESHALFPLKSDRTEQTSNDLGREEKNEITSQPLLSDIKPRNRRLSKLRAPTTYKCKPTSNSESQHMNDSVSQSATVLTTKPTSNLVPFLKFISNTEPSSELTSVSPSEPSSLSASEPSSLSLSEPSSLSQSEPSNLSQSEPSNQFAPEPLNIQSLSNAVMGPSELTNMLTSQPSSRPAFWPQSEPTYKIMHTLVPSSVPATNPVSPRKCTPLSKQRSESLSITKTEPSCLFEPQSSKVVKTLQKSVSASRISRIPKARPNSATDTKVPQKNCGNPSGSKLQRNLKPTAVKTSRADKTATSAKNISDSNKQKQTNSPEKKMRVSQKKSCK